MSPIPVFNQINSTRVYGLSTLADTGMPDYWLCYFASASANFGTNASTTLVWQDIGGCYLFLDKTPPDWAKFASDLAALLPNLGPANTVRFLWITNADKSYTQWQLSKGSASATGSSSTIAWTLIRPISFVLGTYQLSIEGASTLNYIADGDGGGIGFSAGGIFNTYSFPLAQIGFSGSTLGAITGVVAVPAQGDMLSTLTIGMQYAAAPGALILDDIVLPLEDEVDLSLDLAAATNILFMPVFTDITAAVNLSMRFDSLNPTVSSRTAFSLFPPGGNPGLTLGTYMRTTIGYPVQLTPMAATGVLPDAQFVFGYCPGEDTYSTSGYRYHLSPDGAFQMSVQNPSGGIAAAPNQLLLGLSGLEYMNLTGTNYMIVFGGNNPAFIPAIPSSQTQAPDIANALTTAATTSYLTVMSLNTSNETEATVYYAQPREAPIFSGNGPSQGDGILNFNPMPAFTIPYNVQQLPDVFPTGIYSGLTSDFSSLARAMENTSIAPFRNYMIGNAYGVSEAERKSLTLPSPKRRVRDVNDPLGVTPQGLVAELTPDYQDFDGLIIGNMPGTNYPIVQFTAVEGMFKQAIQNNQLFFVAANVDVLMSGTSIQYELTAADQPYLLALNVPQQVITNVYNAIAASGTIQPFETENAFVSCIGTAAIDPVTQIDYISDFLFIGGILKVEMDGWTFQLSPRSWRTDPDSPTLMIAKFCNRSLMDLAQDSSSWSWPEVATPQNGLLGQTQTVLLNIFNAAMAVTADASLRIFDETVLNNANWNGFLFLNAPVDIAELPNELKFLTAGIDLTEFYAHHIGFSQTPFTVTNSQPVLEQTAAFGLINYEDTLDLTLSETIPLGFKTMQLRARFANAALVDFSAQVELMLNQLLGSVLSKSISARGNNLIINGSYQRVGGAPSYAFTLTGENIFNANDSALTNIEVLSVQLVTGGDTSAVEVLTTFILNGNLRFVLIEGFDLFSFGPGENTSDSYLPFSGLSIDMSFQMTAPLVQTFDVREENTAFDLTNPLMRKSSLLNNFPLSVSKLLSSPNLSPEGETPTGQTPEDMGYTSISAPLDQVPMVPGWYGLVYTLDLGTFGALTGSVSFKISILAAWSKGPAENTIPVYIGLKFPAGISAIGGSFPLQGVLKLGFRSFLFETYHNTQGQLCYQLRMKRFALSVLVWSFPPGNTDIVLFGDPGNPKGSLGWYAAYDSGTSSATATAALTGEAKSDIKTKMIDPVKKRLKSGRRTPPVK
ncbi:hypothetical protein BH11BAC7_BH11BAC7_11510 [soil metagenome]